MSERATLPTSVHAESSSSGSVPTNGIALATSDPHNTEGGYKLTGYILLIAVSTCAILIPKAIFSVRGMATGNTLDWIWALPITLFFLILGGCDNNRPRTCPILWRWLFDEDCSFVVIIPVVSAVIIAVPISLSLSSYLRSFTIAHSKFFLIVSSFLALTFLANTVSTIILWIIHDYGMHTVVRYLGMGPMDRIFPNALAYSLLALLQPSVFFLEPESVYMGPLLLAEVELP